MELGGGGLQQRPRRGALSLGLGLSLSLGLSRGLLQTPHVGPRHQQQVTQQQLHHLGQNDRR